MINASVCELGTFSQVGWDVYTWQSMVGIHMATSRMGHQRNDHVSARQQAYTLVLSANQLYVLTQLPIGCGHECRASLPPTYT